MKKIYYLICFLAVILQPACHLEKLTPEGSGDADFTVSLTDNDGFAPCRAQFQNLSANGISFEWDFGDGSVHSTAPNPAYEYLKPGDYLVTLTITDVDGIQASVTKPVTIKTRTFKKLIDDFNTFEVNDVVETGKGEFWVVGSGVDFSDLKPIAYLMQTDKMGNKTNTSFYDPVTTGATVLEIIDDLPIYFGTDQSANPSIPFIHGLNPPDQYFTEYIPEATYMVDAVKTTDGTYVFIANNLGQIYISKSNAFPQPGWSGYLGSGGTTNGSDLSQTSDGGYVVSGTLGDFSSGHIYLYLVKLNSSGNIQWVYNSFVLDELVSCEVAQTTDGQFMVCAGSRVIRIGAGGNLLWAKSFPADGTFVGIAPSLDNGAVAVGNNSGGVALLKVNQQGNKVWGRSYNSGLFNNEGRAIRATSDCGFIVLGAATADHGFAPYLIKTDADGLVE